MSTAIDAWLAGPVEGVPPLLMPVAHGLLQARRDVERVASDLTADELWARPGGAASVGFHLRHIAGSIDRLVTYARGVPLTEGQREALRHEQAPDPSDTSAGELLAAIGATVDAALAVLRATSPDTLLEFRGVGRAQRPSNVLGLLAHAGEHAQRHAGQVITTVAFLRGQSASPLTSVPRPPSSR